VTLYGPVESTYYQVTPMGIDRVQSGRLPNIDVASKRVLADLFRMGGYAEWDELKMMATANPQVLSVALKRLVDLGYVTSGVPGAIQVGGG